MMKVIYTLSIAALVLILAMSAFAQHQGLVLYLKFDELDGDQIKDHSGLGNHGTAVGNFDLVEGKMGNGIKLDGNRGTYVDVADADSLDLTEIYTIAVWVNFTEITGGRHQFFFDKGCGYKDPGGFRLGKIKDGRIRFQVYKDGSYQDELDINNPGLEPGTWYHIAVTRDENGDATLYLDGVFGATNNLDANILPVNENPCLVGGSPMLGEENMFIGILDEFIFFKDRALTEEEIGSLMETGASAAVNAAGKLAATWGMMKL